MTGMSTSQKIAIIETRYGMSITTCDDRLDLAKQSITLALRDIEANDTTKESRATILRNTIDLLIAKHKEEQRKQFLYNAYIEAGHSQVEAADLVWGAGDDEDRDGYRGEDEDIV